jgi:leucyl-tRNA synthetase
MEHTTLHVLYSRFWHKFLYDQKLVPTSEPYAKRTSHGLILAKDGEKMSKSKGNVVNPDDIVKVWGADSLRLYEMFMGPFDQAIPWSTDNIIGVRRFLEKVWRLQDKVGKKVITEDNKLQSLLQKTIQKVSDDIEAMRFNTAVSAMMILVNELESAATQGSGVTKKNFETFLQLLSPFAPHISEEIWRGTLQHKKSIFIEKWPVADMSKMTTEQATIMIQINGKVRGQVTVPIDSNEEEVLSRATKDENVAKWLVGHKPQKVVYVKNRLINIVINMNL